MYKYTIANRTKDKYRDTSREYILREILIEISKLKAEKK